MLPQALHRAASVGDNNKQVSFELVYYCFQILCRGHSPSWGPWGRCPLLRTQPASPHMPLLGRPRNALSGYELCAGHCGVTFFSSFFLKIEFYGRTVALKSTERARRAALQAVTSHLFHSASTVPAHQAQPPVYLAHPPLPLGVHTLVLSICVSL